MDLRKLLKKVRKTITAIVGLEKNNDNFNSENTIAIILIKSLTIIKSRNLYF